MSRFRGLKTLALVRTIQTLHLHYTSVRVIRARGRANLRTYRVQPIQWTKHNGTVSHKPSLEQSANVRQAFQKSASIPIPCMQYCTTVTWLGDRRRRSRWGGVCTGDSRGATLWDGASLGQRIVRVQLFESPSQVAVFSMQLLFVHCVFPLSVLQVLQQQQRIFNMTELHFLKLYRH